MQCYAVLNGCLVLSWLGFGLYSLASVQGNWIHKLNTSKVPCLLSRLVIDAIEVLCEPCYLTWTPEAKQRNDKDKDHDVRRGPSSTGQGLSEL